MNATISKFGYPQTLLRDYQHWVLLLRPAQVTAGSLILAAKGEATAFADLPEAAFTEQAAIVAELERLLKNRVSYEKINYLMLMMVDPHVHFHIFPRYQGERSIAGLVLTDHGWPGPPDLKSAVKLDSTTLGRVVEFFR